MDIKKIVYVVGYYFNQKVSTVFLIKKIKPLWQKNKLNGVGGKLEEFDDSPLAAMIREFKEETSCDVEDWQELTVRNFNDQPDKQIYLHVFYAKGDKTPVTTEHEEIVEININRVGILDREHQLVEGCCNDIITASELLNFDYE